MTTARAPAQAATLQAQAMLCSHPGGQGTTGIGAAAAAADVTGGSQLSPLALHCCLEELGKDDRLAQLQQQELAGVAAAAAALQLRLPAGWLDRLISAVEQQLPQLSGPALALLTASLPQLLPAGSNLRLWRQLGGVVQSQGSRRCEQHHLQQQTHSVTLSTLHWVVVSMSLHCASRGLLEFGGCCGSFLC